MALTESNMLPIGTKAPSFSLMDTISDQNIGYEQVKGENGTMIVFSCNHCPFVVHINDQLVSIAEDYLPKGIGFAAISSNDVVNYPQDAPDKMKIVAKVLKYPFPYLYDEDQSVAKSYNAACTPDFYLFDENDILIYRGRMDGSRPGNNVAVTGSDLRFAIDALLVGVKEIKPQIPSAGCNIKWLS